MSKTKTFFYSNAHVQFSQNCTTSHECRGMVQKTKTKTMCKHVKEVAKF